MIKRIKVTLPNFDWVGFIDCVVRTEDELLIAINLEAERDIDKATAAFYADLEDFKLEVVEYDHS